MRHALSALVLAAAVGLTAWSAIERPPVPVPSGIAPCVEQSCKPLGPAALEIAALPMDGSGGIPLVFSLRPITQLKSLVWRWEISPELIVLDGAMDGEAATARGEVSEGRLVIVAPPSGRYGRATLVVSGVFTGSDGTDATFDEPFGFQRSVTWGQLPIPVPVVQSPDETGALVDVAVVPSSHRAGR